MQKQKKRLITIGLLFFVALTLNLWVGPEMLAAPLRQGIDPPNDSLANAVDVTNSLPFNTVIDVTNAGLEGGETECGNPPNDPTSVWYQITPTQNGQLSVTATPGGGVDPTLGIFTGGGHPLTQVTCVDAGGGDVTETITNQALTTSTTYWIRVAGYNMAAGQITVDITFTPDAPAGPANDNLANATDVTTQLPLNNQPVTDLSNATLEMGETQCAGDNSDQDSVWYKITPAQSGQLSVTLTPDVFTDVTLGVFSGTAHPLMGVGPCVNNGGNGVAETITNQALTGGTTYVIRVALGVFGSADISISFTPDDPTGPANDDFANAIDISGGLAATVVDLSTTNTGEVGEPVCDPDDADIPRSVWYKLTPTQAGQLSVTVTPAINTVDPTLALFTGTALNNLTRVICQDGQAGVTETITNQALTANTTYYVRVGTYDNAGLGSVTVSATCTGCVTSSSKIFLPLIIKSPAASAAGWQAQTSGVTTKLNSIDCPTTTFCVAVGDGGRVLTTANSGTTWSSKSSGVTNNLNDVSCIDQAICIAVGDGGRIIYSDSSGATWSSKSSGTTQNLRGVGCATTTCFAVGGTATSTGVLSTNGGNSWSNAPVSLGNTDLYGASCPNDGTCTIVGFFGRVLVFAGNGVKAGPFNLGKNLLDVDCPTEAVCLTVGVAGEIQKTSNGGSNWSGRTSGTSQVLEGVSCNGSTCYVAGAGGTVITSADSGENWKAETTNVTTNLRGISCPSATTCFAVGDGGTILGKK